MPYTARHSLLKMINSQVPEDRKLFKFPEPYKPQNTPYLEKDFSEITYRKCAENNNIVTNLLKICKIIIIGDASVGKTCIVNRFCQKIFDSNYKSTIGVDFEVERFDILNVGFNLQIWDTAGQERFKSIAQSYYRAAQVFDFSNLDSLTNCKTWLNEALNTSNTFSLPFLFLVGSKQDLLPKYAFKNAEINAAKVANSLNAEYWTVSSKTGLNIDKLFCRIAALAFDQSIKNEMEKRIQCIQIGTDLISFKKNVNSPKENNKCNQFKC